MNRFDPKNTFCIEVAASRNRRLLWQPTSATLRGRWSLANFPMVNAQEALQRLSMLGDIPGMFVQVDTKELICRVVDPLEATPKGRELFKKIEITCKTHPELFGSNGIRVVPEAIIGGGEDMEKSDRYTMVKTWTYWMRRAINAKHAEEVSGYVLVPKMADILEMPGKVDAIPLDDIREGDRYRHSRPIPGEKQATAGSGKS